MFLLTEQFMHPPWNLGSQIVNKFLTINKRIEGFSIGKNVFYYNVDLRSLKYLDSFIYCNKNNEKKTFYESKLSISVILMYKFQCLSLHNIIEPEIKYKFE